MNEFMEAVEAHLMLHILESVSRGGAIRAPNQGSMTVKYDSGGAILGQYIKRLLWIT